MKIQRVCGGRRREHAASQAAALRCLGAGRTGRRRTQRAMGVRREARWDHTMVGPEERIERVVEKHAACRHVERSLLDDGLHRRMGKYMRRRSRELKIEAGSGVGYRCARREAERIVWRRGGYGGRCMPIRKGDYPGLNWSPPPAETPFREAIPRRRILPCRMITRFSPSEWAALSPLWASRPGWGLCL